MALTRLPKKGLADNSVDSSKIEDGTVRNLEISGTLNQDRLEASTIPNSRLSNNSITYNSTSVSLGDNITDKFIDWQSVITADGSTTTTAVAGRGYIIDTSSNAHTINLPSSASLGDTVAIKDYAESFGTNNLTIGRNSHNIQGVAEDSLLNTNRASVKLVYVDSTKGWLYTNEHNVGDLVISQFTEATGGTVTTTGDFKVHSFTSDGCFAVSQTGAGQNGGPSNVDYLVVAGGGGGSTVCGAGGGAGGYRTSFPSPGCNAGSHPISVQTYPIVVGAGGTGFVLAAPNPAIPANITQAPGSNSTFDTITSAGGGAGGNVPSIPNRAGAAGGSGGGGAGNGGSPGSAPGGAGNTPPVSPAQGNAGGAGDTGPSPQRYGGGGGGASAVGQAGPSGGDGGDGSPNSITGSAVTYAGGGGGASEGPVGRSSDGGAGGGGPSPAASGTNGVSGTANTGGGGGSHNRGTNGGQTGNGGSGGSGIVIIRYKYQ